MATGSEHNDGNLLDRNPEQLWALKLQIQRMWVESDMSPERLADANISCSKGYAPEIFDCVGDTVNYGNEDIEKYYIVRYMVPYMQASFLSLENGFSEKEAYRSWCNINLRDNLHIVSIGGGPGTDLFAVLAHFRARTEQQFSVSATVLDLCTNWQRQFDYLNVNKINCQYEKFDMTNGIDIQSKKEEIGRADVVTMFKTVSSIRKRQVVNSYFTTWEILKDIFAQMKRGSLVIYMDTRLDFLVTPLSNAASYNEMTQIFNHRREFSFEPCNYHDVQLFNKPKLDLIIFQKN